MNTEKEINIVLELLLDTGELFLKNGAETYRAEQSVRYMYEGLSCGGKINVFALTTMLSVDIVIEGRHYCGVRRIDARTIDLDKIETLNRISRDLSNGKTSVAEARAMLTEASGEEQRMKIPVVIAYGLAAGAFAFLIKGSWPEMLGAFISCILVQIFLLLMKNVVLSGFFSSLLGGALPTLIGVAAAHFINCDAHIIAIAGMLPHFPGVAMVNAIRDTINGDILSGVARGAEAMLTAIGLAMGAVIVWHFALMI